MTEIRPDVVKQLDMALGVKTRRDFLRLVALGGMGFFLPTVVTACNSDSILDPSTKATFAFGSDRGALNVAFAFAQFMKEFYSRATFPTFPGMTLLEQDSINAIADQKGTQRDVLHQLVPSGRIVDALLFDFSTVDFSSRTAVMVDFAQPFEDLGVAALNGAAATMTNPTNLTLLSEIASVWARHAAVIRDLNDIAAGRDRISFAASADSRGLDPATAPATVVQILQPFFHTTLSTSGV